MHATKCVFSNKLQLGLCHSKAICNQACTFHRPRLDSFHQEPVVKCRSLVLFLVLRPVVEVLSQAACLKVLAEPKPAVLSDGANAKSTRIENSHLMRFIEIFLAGIDPGTGDIVAECYGAYANPDVPANKDTAPQALVGGLDMNQLKTLLD